jgi:hypothetical protein
VRFPARRVDKSDALSDHPPDRTPQGGFDEVPSPFLTDARIARLRCLGAALLWPFRQVGQLLHDDLGPDGFHPIAERRRVKDIDDNGMRAGSLELRRPVGVSCRSVDLVAGIEQERG